MHWEILQIAFITAEKKRSYLLFSIRLFQVL